jgi:hypothetical protein
MFTALPLWSMFNESTLELRSLGSVVSVRTQFSGVTICTIPEAGAACAAWWGVRLLMAGMDLLAVREYEMRMYDHAGFLSISWARSFASYLPFCLKCRRCLARLYLDALRHLHGRRQCNSCVGD